MIKSLIIALIALFSTSSLLLAEPIAEESQRERQQPSRREKQPSQGERSNTKDSEKESVDRKMWRAFNEMSSEEREQARELQSSNPAEFEKMIQNRIEQIEARENEQQAQLESIVKRYKEATTDDEKSLCTKELSAIIKERYLKRLEHNRNHIEELRKKVKKLDEELTQREKESDEFVAEQVDNILNNPDKQPQKREGREGREGGREGSREGRKLRSGDTM